MTRIQATDVHTGTVAHSVHSIFLERSFWLRVWRNSKNDLLFIYKSINVMLAILLAVSLFLLELVPIKEFMKYFVALPLSLFVTVKYLTLLPVIFFIPFLYIQPKYSAIVLSIISVVSFVWVLLV